MNYDRPEPSTRDLIVSSGGMSTLDQLRPEHRTVIKIDSGVDVIHNSHEKLAGIVGAYYPFRKAFEEKGEQSVPHRRQIRLLELRRRR